MTTRTQEFRDLWIVPGRTKAVWVNEIDLAEEDDAAIYESGDDPYGWFLSDVYGIEITAN